MSNSFSEKIVAEISLPPKLPVDCHGRTIEIGDEVVIHRKDRLYPGKVIDKIPKKKSQRIFAYSTKPFPPDPLLAAATKALPDGFHSGTVMVNSEYFSIKVKCPGVSWDSGKDKNVFSTPDPKRIVVTGRS